MKASSRGWGGNTPSLDLHLQLSEIFSSPVWPNLVLSLLSAPLLLSPPQRIEGFFLGGEDPLSNVSAGTGLQVMAHLTLRLQHTSHSGFI